MYRNGRLALNPGGLCGKFIGKPCGGYAILTWDKNRWRAELRELYYDMDLIRKSYLESGLLDEVGAFARYFLRDLETGTNSLPRFVDFAWEMANKEGYAESSFVPDHIWEQADILFASELSKGNIPL